MAEYSKEQKGSRCSTIVKKVLCASVLVIAITLVIIGIRYRFFVSNGVTKIVTGDDYPIYGNESIMSQKAHGTTETAV